MKLKGIKAIAILAVLVMAFSSVAVVSSFDEDDADEIYEAKILKTGTADVYCNTLAEALTNAAAGDTILVLKNIEVTSSIAINKELTIDFNGKTLKATGMGNNNIFQIGGFGGGPVYGDDFTLMNCKFSAESSGTDVNCIQIEFSGSVTVSDCTFKCFTGLNREIRAVGQDAEALLTVTGCSFDSAMGAEGDLVKISGTYAPIVFTSNTITSKATGTNFCMKTFGDSDAMGYTIAAPEAKIGTDNYLTLRDAIALAESSSTITVLKAIETSSSIWIGKSLTIDFNGNSIKATNMENNNIFQIGGFGSGPVFDGSFTLKKCVFSSESNGDDVNCIQIEFSGSVTIDTCTFYDFDGLNREIRAVGQDAEAQLTINKCKFDVNMGAEGDIVKISGEYSPIVLTSNSFTPSSSTYKLCMKSYGVAGAMGYTIATPEAQIGTDYYATLQDAVFLAADEATISVLKDIEVESSIRIDKSLTINFNGKTLTATDLGNYNIFQIGGFGGGPVYEGDFILNKCVFSANSTGDDVNCIQIEFSGSVTIDNCTFNKFAGLNREIRAVGQDTEAQLTINKCKFDANMGAEGDIVKISGQYAPLIFTYNTIQSGETGSEFCLKAYKTADEMGYTIAVPEAQIGDYYFATLAEALSAVEDDGTVIVLRDISVEAPIVIDVGKSFTLDFDDNELTATGLGNYNMFQIGGFGSGPAYAGDFTLVDCVFSADSSGTEVNCIQIEFSGTVTVTGCTFNSFEGLNREIRAVGQDTVAQLTVTGCSFDADLGLEKDIVKISGKYSPMFFELNTIDSGETGSEFCLKAYTKSDEMGYTIAVPEAQIGDDYFATLVEAIAAVSEDYDEITVLRDIEVKSSICIDKSMTIDFDGYELTATGLGNYNIFQIGGFGSGPVYAGDFILRNCEFSSESTGDDVNCIQIESSGSVTIDNCTFNDFTGLNREVRMVGQSKVAQLTIQNCEFDADMGAENDIVKMSGKYMPLVFTDNSIINGDTGSQFCLKAYTKSDEMGYTIAVPEAQIGDDYFATLGEAIAAVSEDYDEITVLMDIEVESPILIDKSMTIDFNNKTLTATDLGNYNIFQIGGFGSGPTYTGDFILENCVFSASSNGTEVNCIQIEFSGSVTIDNCTFNDFTGLNREIRAVGKSTQSQLTVENCSFGATMGLEGDIVKISGQYKPIVFTDNTILSGPTGSQFCVKAYTKSDEMGYTIAVPEAKIGDNYYATVMEAFEAVSTNQTVTLLRNCEFDDGTVLIDKEGVKVDGNAKTLVISASNINLKNNTSFENVVFEANGEDNMFKVSYSTSVNLSFKDCEFKGESSDKDMNYLYLGDSYKGKLVIDGCMFDNTSATVDRDIVVKAGSNEANTSIKIVNSNFSTGAGDGNATPVKINGKFTYEFSGNTMGTVPLITAAYDGGTVLTTESNCAAQIGDTKYISFEEALGIVKSGQTLTVINDVNVKNSITVGSGVVLIIADGKSLILKDSASPFIDMTVLIGASLSGRIAYDAGEGDVNAAVFTDMKAGVGAIVIAHGSMRISGTVDASSDVTIDAQGNVKLDGITVDESTGSLIITKTGSGSEIEIEDLEVSSGASVNIMTDVTMLGDNEISGEINVARDTELEISSGAKLKINEDAVLNNSGTIAIVSTGTLDNDGTIVNDTPAKIENAGTISSTSKDGIIVNSGKIENIGTGTMDRNITVMDTKINQVRFNIEQFVYSDSRSGVDVTVLPDSNIAGVTVKEPVKACVKYIINDNSVPELGTIVVQKTVNVILSTIEYEDGNAYFEVDLKTGNPNFSKISTLWVEYTFQASDDKQVTAVSDLFKFDPRREYITASS